MVLRRRRCDRSPVCRNDGFPSLSSIASLIAKVHNPHIAIMPTKNIRNTIKIIFPHPILVDFFSLRVGDCWFEDISFNELRASMSRASIPVFAHLGL